MTDNAGCGVSISDGVGDMGFHTVAEDCPAEGMVHMLPDAFFVAGGGSPGTAQLTQGQELLVLVSCAYRSMPVKETDYTLSITKQ